MDLRPGDTIYGDSKESQYQIVEPCGNGQFGVVFKIKDATGTFALKTISTGWLDAQALAVLQNEGQLATQVVHTNALRVYYFHDGKTHDGLPPYMIMEFADGGTLQDVLRERQATNSIFTTEELSNMFRALACGMKAINERLVHRDIKPDNILICGGTLKVADFGLAKVVGAATRSSTFKGINHIRYCAPEAWHLETNAISMDMYSMGIVFYEIATLRHPYAPNSAGNIVDAWKQAHLTSIPDDPRKHNPSVSCSLSQVIMKLLAKRPADRYGTWDEVLARIDSAPAATAAVNIAQLVQRAAASRSQAEASRVKQEEETKRARERMNLVSHCFKEIADAADEVVSLFNASSDDAQLRMGKSAMLSFSIQGPHGTVHAAVSVAESEHTLQRKRIRAWGHVQAPGGRGFNLILVADDDNDLYGRWKTLHVKHNPMSRHPDHRPEPFFFTEAELPRELQLLDALHVFVTQVGRFDAQMLTPLIEEIL